MPINSIIKRTGALLCAAVISTTAIPLSGYAAMDKSEFKAGYSYSTEMRGLTAFQIVNDMGAGWNLGNSLDSSNSETSWGNPATTKAMIDDIAERGFTTLRVPVRWDDHYSNASSYTISEDYIDRVETVVNYGLANGMYVILNVHHNDLQTMIPDTDRVSKELKAIWTQVGKRFKNYGDKLIFEVNNEPRGMVNGSEDWNGNAEKYESVNKCNEAARAAIRATGGNNENRLVMLPTYAASCDAAKASAWTKNESDDMIAASIHAYLPFDFAFQGNGHKTWQQSDVKELEAFFERVDTYFLSKGVPVVIGECGSVNKNNTAEREKCAEIYGSMARQFAQQDIPCILWDNGGFSVGTENFGLYNRRNGSFTYGTVCDAIIDAYSGNPDCETQSAGDNVIFKGSATAANYAKTADFDGQLVSSMKVGDVLVAEYSGMTPHLCLQSWSGGKEWVQFAPDKASGGKATWTYETIKKQFGGSLDLLNKCYISAVSAKHTLTKLYIPAGGKHTHDFSGKEAVTIPATATTKGRKTVQCSVEGCGEVKVSVIAKGSTAQASSTVPENLKAASADKAAKLSWSKVDGATKYAVYMYKNGKFTPIKTNITKNSYTKKSLKNGTKYRFRVKAYVNGKWSELSEEVKVTPASKTVPQNVKASAGDEKVTLSWSKVSGATKYAVYVKKDGKYKAVTVSLKNNRCTIKGLDNGVKYSYKIRAYVNGKWSGYSSTVSATPKG